MARLEPVARWSPSSLTSRNEPCPQRLTSRGDAFGWTLRGIRRVSGPPGESRGRDAGYLRTPGPDGRAGGSIRDEGEFRSLRPLRQCRRAIASRDPDRCALRETALLHTSTSPIRYRDEEDSPSLLAAVAVASPAFAQNDECTGASRSRRRGRTDRIRHDRGDAERHRLALRRWRWTRHLVLVHDERDREHRGLDL